MPLPTWAEITALLMMIGGVIAWLDRRRGRIAELQEQVATLTGKVTELEGKLTTAMDEADKTDRSHQEAMTAKNAEITEWRRQVERRDDRIEVLEDRLYTGGGRT